MNSIKQLIALKKYFTESMLIQHTQDALSITPLHYPTRDLHREEL